MKVYLIDACNYVLKKIVDNKEHINAGLEKLIFILNELKKNTKDSYIVFIDGKEETMFNKTLKGNILCIFSSSTSTADNVIIDYIRDNSGRDYFVVTDDNELRTKVKNFKVQVLSCNEFAILCKKALGMINEEDREHDPTNYIFFKQNPFIPEAEVEEQYKEFIENYEENF